MNSFFDGFQFCPTIDMDFEFCLTVDMIFDEGEMFRVDF